MTFSGLKQGQDLENRAAHSHQEFLGVIAPGLNDTFEDTAISRKVVGKCACDNPDSYCG